MEPITIVDFCYFFELFRPVKCRTVGHPFGTFLSHHFYNLSASFEKSYVISGETTEEEHTWRFLSAQTQKAVCRVVFAEHLCCFPEDCDMNTGE